jgi:hypothetical protein
MCASSEMQKTENVPRKRRRKNVAPQGLNVQHSTFQLHVHRVARTHVLEVILRVWNPQPDQDYGTNSILTHAEVSGCMSYHSMIYSFNVHLAFTLNCQLVRTAISITDNSMLTSY